MIYTINIHTYIHMITSPQLQYNLITRHDMGEDCLLWQYDMGLYFNIIINYHFTHYFTLTITFMNYNYYHCLVMNGISIFYYTRLFHHHITFYFIDLLCFELGLDSCYMDGLKDTIGGEFIIALAFTFTIYLFICRCTCWYRWLRFIYLLSSGV